MNPNMLMMMASKLKHFKVKTNTIICRQDDVSKSVYFIKSGKVKIVKDVAFYTPLSKYQTCSSNAMFKENPLKKLKPIDIHSI